jgi:hypothetical protein
MVSASISPRPQHPAARRRPFRSVHKSAPTAWPALRMKVRHGRIADRVRRTTPAFGSRAVCYRRACPVTWRGREARNEVRFRDQNEWIEATTDGFGLQPSSDRTMTFVCECGDASCVEEVQLSREEYEAVRSVSNRFAIALHHENPESEVVISESMRYAVVDKIAGVAMQIARDTDPRSDMHVPRDPRIEEHR